MVTWIFPRNVAKDGPSANPPRRAPFYKPKASVRCLGATVSESCVKAMGKTLMDPVNASTPKNKHGGRLEKTCSARRAIGAKDRNTKSKI